MQETRLSWDWGTAYDLFVSLSVLHRPAEFGVRGAWAAGVRARLPVAERETLKQAQVALTPYPLQWLRALPEPKDGATALWALQGIPPGDRLTALGLPHAMDPKVREALLDVAARGGWDERHEEMLRRHARASSDTCSFTAKEVPVVLEAWSRPAVFGERYLQALRKYHEVFFSQEEQRLAPALRIALERARKLAEKLALPQLLDELSQGLRFAKLGEISELMLVPSYWTTPLLIIEETRAGREIWLFGAKPADASLVPGEVVPDALLRALKALSDPTRLRIMRYLTQEPLTPSELARRLRLRAPTVTHHLQALRLAGLVHITVGEEGGTEKEPYTARVGAVAGACAALQGFLEQRESPAGQG